MTGNWAMLSSHMLAFFPLGLWQRHSMKGMHSLAFSFRKGEGYLLRCLNSTAVLELLFTWGNTTEQPGVSSSASSSFLLTGKLCFSSCKISCEIINVFNLTVIVLSFLLTVNFLSINYFILFKFVSTYFYFLVKFKQQHFLQSWYSTLHIAHFRMNAVMLRQGSYLNKGTRTLYK